MLLIGGYVESNGIEYKIHNVKEVWTGYFTYEPVDSVKNGITEYDMPYKSDEGEQKRVRFGVSAKNAKGESTITMTPDFIVGKPYELPFMESVKGGKLNNTLWVVTATGSSTFSIDKSGQSADSDGGCLKYYSVNDADMATLNTGKIKMTGASNAQLIFSHKARIGSNSVIKVWAKGPDGTRYELGTVKYAEMTGQGSPWTRSAIKMKPEFSSMPYVVVGFDVSAPEWEKIYLDDFCFRDVKDNDLGVRDLVVPASIKKGSESEVTLHVVNYGEKPADTYQVNLYANGKLVDTREETSPLEALAERVYTLSYKNDVFDQSSSVTLKVEVAYASDMYLADNTAESEATVIAVNKPKPETVTAEKSADGVKVEWSAVDGTSKTVTDSFEDYASWSTDKFGDWSGTYDFKGETAGLFQQYAYPHQGEKFAYIVADPLNGWLSEETLQYNENLKAHSGNKYLAAFYSYIDGSIVDADNWLISPELSGEEQTISFWASNSKVNDKSYPETFDVLYTTDSEAGHDKYVKVDDTQTVSACQWTNYSFKLPEDAKRFAIHNNTYRSDNFVFMVDDITYRVGFGTMLGYNIYRDGKFIATVPVDATQFIDHSVVDGNTYTYAVTTLFADGESEATAAIPVVVASVDGITEDMQKNMPVYSIDGKYIGKNGESDCIKRAKGILIIGDRKVVKK